MQKYQLILKLQKDLYFKLSQLFIKVSKIKQIKKNFKLY